MLSRRLALDEEYLKLEKDYENFEKELTHRTHEEPVAKSQPDFDEKCYFN
jgi:hypothetical protein